MTREQIQSFLVSIGLDGWAQDTERLSGVERVMAGRWQPIESAPKDRTEFIVVLPDGTVRTATWGLGTILLGAYGIPPQPHEWPTHWASLPRFTPPEG